MTHSNSINALGCSLIMGAIELENMTKYNSGNFLGHVTLKSRGLIQHKPVLSPAYLLFLVSSLHKYDLYPSSEQDVPLMRKTTQSVSPSPIQNIEGSKPGGGEGTERFFS